MEILRTPLFAGILVVVALLLLVPPTAHCQEQAKEDARAKERYVVVVEDMKFEYEGDATEKRDRRNSIPIGFFGVWPNGIVPFEFSTTFTESERRLFFLAMQHWEEFTCVRFRPKTNSDVYSIQFVTGDPGQCQSYIGRISFIQPQPVTLGPGCVFFSVIVHEIGHALGFYHEHSRPDRDEYITVISNNVLSGFLDAFDTVSPLRSSSFNFGYDYASIMHYSPTTFARANTEAIITNQPEIHFGDAAELSPLDIAKTNALYQCGPRDTHPPRSVVVPPEPPAAIPGRLSCGSVTDATRDGSVRSPGFPSHRTNQDCAFVLRAPEGHSFSFRFPGFQLEQSTGCTKDYVQIFSGSSISSNNLIVFNGYPGGRMCLPEISRFIFSLSGREITFLYHTDGSNSGSVRGLEIDYELIDVNECASNGEGSKCHTCTNRIGSFDCGCNAGFYLSKPASTCFDVNECAVETDGRPGGCDHTCVNYAGSYECTCRSGFFLQTDGKSCGQSRPAFAPTVLPPGTSLPRIQTSPTATTRPTTPTTVSPTSSGATLSASCGGGPSILTSLTDSIQTVGWPNTAYPLNVECTWDIVCPAGSKIEIEFEDTFRIAGSMPTCTKDSVTISDCNGAIEHGPFCHLTRPETFETTCSAVKVTFDSNGVRGGTRYGFKMNYVCKSPSIPPMTVPTTARPTTARPTTARPTTARPTTARPTTTQPPTISPLCGGGPEVRRDLQGSVETLGWGAGQAYSVNTVCKWRIECPSSQRVQLVFSSSFRIAGQMPSCTKDELKINDCNGAITYGPFCHLTAPQPNTSVCNAVDVVFTAGGERGSSRSGFRLNYECV